MCPIYLQTPNSLETRYRLMGARNSIIHRLKINGLIPKTQVNLTTVHSFYGRCEYHLNSDLMNSWSTSHFRIDSLQFLIWIQFVKSLYMYIWFVNVFLLINCHNTSTATVRRCREIWRVYRVSGKLLCTERREVKDR